MISFYVAFPNVVVILSFFSPSMLTSLPSVLIFDKIKYVIYTRVSVKVFYFLCSPENLIILNLFCL